MESSRVVTATILTRLPPLRELLVCSFEARGGRYSPHSASFSSLPSATRGLLVSNQGFLGAFPPALVQLDRRSLPVTTPALPSNPNQNAHSTPRQSVSAKHQVMGTLGADHLGLRTTSWAPTTYVDQNKHIKPKAVRDLLSTELGPGRPSDASHKATGAALLRTSTSTSIAFSKRAGPGDWAGSTYVEPGQMQASLHATREVSRQHVAAATGKVLIASKKEYKSPWRVQEEAMATMRGLKATGQWPAPPPKQTVLASTTRAKTRPVDLQDVLDLDTFRVSGMEVE